MKKSELQQIIKEEIESVLSEGPFSFLKKQARKTFVPKPNPDYDFSYDALAASRNATKDGVPGATANPLDRVKKVFGAPDIKPINLAIANLKQETRLNRARAYELGKHSPEAKELAAAAWDEIQKIVGDFQYWKKITSSTGDTKVNRRLQKIEDLRAHLDFVALNQYDRAIPPVLKDEYLRTQWQQHLNRVDDTASR
jgi:hypothetical protein